MVLLDVAAECTAQMRAALRYEEARVELAEAKHAYATLREMLPREWEEVRQASRHRGWGTTQDRVRDARYWLEVRRKEYRAALRAFNDADKRARGEVRHAKLAGQSALF